MNSSHMVVSVHSPDHHPAVLEQAPVRALDPDGAAIVSLGTAAFAVASVVCWIEFEALSAAGQGWWLGVCVVGVGIGLVGSAITWTRHRRRKAGAAAEADEVAGADRAATEA